MSRPGATTGKNVKQFLVCVYDSQRDQNGQIQIKHAGVKPLGDKAPDVVLIAERGKGLTSDGKSTVNGISTAAVNSMNQGVYKAYILMPRLFSHY